MSSKFVLGVALALASLLFVNTGSSDRAPPLHKGPWPIRNGRNYQRTDHELRTLHLEMSRPVRQTRSIDCTISSWQAANKFAIGIPHPNSDCTVAETESNSREACFVRLFSSWTRLPRLA